MVAFLRFNEPGRDSKSSGNTQEARTRSVARVAPLRDLTAAAHPIDWAGNQQAIRPFSIQDSSSPDWAAPEPLDLTIDQVIQMALANGTVLRTLGARIIQTPGAAPTIYEPAIQVTDPTSGIEAALSAYDATLQGDLNYEDNDRVLNNEFAGQGVNLFRQYLTNIETSLSKQAGYGDLVYAPSQR